MDAKTLIAELEFEMVSAGKLLNLVPADKLDWKPNSRAMTLGQLALHVALIPGRYTDFADTGTTTFETLVDHASPKSKAEVLESFKTSLAKGKAFFNNINQWENKTWNLMKGDKAVLTLPVPLFVRLLVFNHWVHHRGQLSTYLKTLNVSMPSIYGPSADENPFA
ncbi:hypothetical protein WSM22_31620 [Cytophagales bacterium WSM2-2]|nr:hypothetical protein WSM22_31620 [Cytophagales bacterium WSM2-2]